MGLLGLWFCTEFSNLLELIWWTCKIYLVLKKFILSHFLTRGTVRMYCVLMYLSTYMYIVESQYIRKNFQVSLCVLDQIFLLIDFALFLTTMLWLKFWDYCFIYDDSAVLMFRLIKHKIFVYSRIHFVYAEFFWWGIQLDDRLDGTREFESTIDTRCPQSYRLLSIVAGAAPITYHLSLILCLWSIKNSLQWNDFCQCSDCLWDAICNWWYKSLIGMYNDCCNVNGLSWFVRRLFFQYACTGSTS